MRGTVLPKMIDCSRNHARARRASCPIRLRPRRETAASVLAVEPLKNIVHRRALKIFQAGKSGAVSGRCSFRHRLWAASQMGSQIF